jgi:hypothetical protein
MNNRLSICSNKDCYLKVEKIGVVLHFSSALYIMLPEQRNERSSPDNQKNERRSFNSQRGERLSPDSQINERRSFDTQRNERKSVDGYSGALTEGKRSQNFEIVQARSELKKKINDLNMLKKSSEIARVQLKTIEGNYDVLKNAMDVKEKMANKKQRIMAKLNITNQMLIQTLNNLELNTEMIDGFISTQRKAEGGELFMSMNNDTYLQNLKLKESLLNLTRLFIVGLFCYFCIFYYLYVDSLTYAYIFIHIYIYTYTYTYTYIYIYAFGWSAFLGRIGFCDTFVVIFLSKHHRTRYCMSGMSCLRLSCCINA